MIALALVVGLVGAVGTGSLGAYLQVRVGLGLAIPVALLCLAVVLTAETLLILAGST